MVQELSALESLYAEWDRSMVQDFRKKDFRGSFTTAERLLWYADLPLLYRARALAILATRRRVDSVALAEEAVRLINEDVRELVQDANEPFPEEQLKIAQAILDVARQHAEPPVTTLQSRRTGTQAVAVLTHGISNVSLETTTTVSAPETGGNAINDAAPQPGTTKDEKSKKSKKSKKRKKKAKTTADITSSQFWSPPAEPSPSITNQPSAALRETTPASQLPTRNNDLLLTPFSLRESIESDQEMLDEE